MAIRKVLTHNTDPGMPTTYSKNNILTLGHGIWYEQDLSRAVQAVEKNKKKLLMLFEY